MIWEYTNKCLWQSISGLETRNKQVLNKFGAEGWELVSVDNGIAYFKRPNKEANDKMLEDMWREAMKKANEIGAMP